MCGKLVFWSMQGRRWLKSLRGKDFRVPLSFNKVWHVSVSYSSIEGLCRWKHGQMIWNIDLERGMIENLEGVVPLLIFTIEAWTKESSRQMLTRPGYSCLRALELPAVRRGATDARPGSTMSSFPSAENVGIWNIVLILLMKKNSTRSGTVLVDLGLAFHPWSPWAARVECWLGASGKTWKLGSEKRRDLGKLRCQVECLRLETSRKVAQHGISFDRSMMACIN